jgi:biopolymer transport protein ExbD
MDGPFGGRSQRRRPNINIAPLIDVMFLLLIFFMVSSTFREHIGVDVKLPESETATEQEEGDRRIFVKQEGVYSLGDEDLDGDGLRGKLAEIISEDPEAVLVIDGDRAASFQAVVRAMDIARDAGGRKLVISTEAAGIARKASAERDLTPSAPSLAP